MRACRVHQACFLSPVAMLIVLLVAPPDALAQSKSGPELDDAARRAERERREKAELDDRVRRLVSEFKSYVEETGALVGKLEEKAAAYVPRMTELLTNDDGKRIAQDPTAFLHFVQLQEEPIVSLEDVQARRKSITSLLDSLKKEMEQIGVGYVPDAKLKKDTDEVYYWARERMARLTESENWLTTVIQRAPKDLDLKNAKTLKAVISEYQARSIDLLNIARMKGESEAEAESAQKMAEAARIAQLERSNAEIARMLRESQAQNERMRIEHELELKQLQAQHEQKVAAMEKQLAEDNAKIKMTKAEAEHIDKQGEAETTKFRLRHKCEESDVQSKLQPFLTPGYVQPDGTTSLDKSPISLSKLRARGALNETTAGLEALIATAIDSGDKLRPRWGFPANVPALSRGREKDLELARTAQKYLIELGDTLVELKMLAP